MARVRNLGDWQSYTSDIVDGLNTLSQSIAAGKAAEQSSDAYLQAMREMNDTNLQSVRETNMANKELYKLQYEDAMNLYHEEQRYNTPQQQVQRLREAGLNPALAFGQGNVSSPVSLPSAAPAQSYREEMAPYEVYSDTFTSGALAQLGAVSESLSRMGQYERESIDNMTRDAYNRKAIEDLQSQIESRLDSGKTSAVERKRLRALIDGLKLENSLFSDTYEDRQSQYELHNNLLRTQERVMNDQNARDASRLAIERLESQSRIKLSDAQVRQIGVLSQLAINADWRASDAHSMDMTLKSLDQSLSKLNLDSAHKQAVFDDIMRESERLHTELKDASELNKIAERAFGLGFRDLGTAIRNLITPK